MKRRTVILEEIFKLLASQTQKEKLLAIYGTGNKGSANHFMLTVVHNKVVRLLKAKKEAQGFSVFQPTEEQRTIKINSARGSSILNL